MEVSAVSNAARASDVTAVKSFCAEAEEGDAAFAAEERVTTTDGVLLGLAFGLSDANATAWPVFLETALSESVVDPAALLRSDATALVADELAAAIVLMVGVLAHSDAQNKIFTRDRSFAALDSGDACYHVT
jgi:hypothetical protein